MINFNLNFFYKLFIYEKIIFLINYIQKMNKSNSEKKNIFSTIRANSTIDSCLVNIIYSYSSIDYTGIINCPIYNNKEYLLTQELLKKLNEYIPINNFQIFYFNKSKKLYILIGIYPNKIIQEKIYMHDSLINIKNKDMIAIKLKFRQIINKDNALKMEYQIMEEDKNEEEKSENSYPELGIKARRAKERKIGSVVKKVYMWRKLYTGVDYGKGTIKLTLEEAAKKVGISKKSLDDYLIQLRNGRNLGFNFNEHKNDKIGVLRSFVKKNKK